MRFKYFLFLLVKTKDGRDKNCGIYLCVVCHILVKVVVLIYSLKYLNITINSVIRACNTNVIIFIFSSGCIFEKALFTPQVDLSSYLVYCTVGAAQSLVLSRLYVVTPICAYLSLLIITIKKELHSA